MKIHKTRFAGMGYAKVGNVWRFVVDGDAVVGPQYASKAELLADLPRYASEYFGL
jgi:hypothetical protein